MKRVRVYHSLYGCDTGCCGHVIEIGDRSRFIFDHPSEGDDAIAFAQRLVREEFPKEDLSDLDWANAVIEVSDD